MNHSATSGLKPEMDTCIVIYGDGNPKLIPDQFDETEALIAHLEPVNVLGYEELL